MRWERTDPQQVLIKDFRHTSDRGVETTYYTAFPLVYITEPDEPDSKEVPVGAFAAFDTTEGWVEQRLDDGTIRHRFGTVRVEFSGLMPKKD